MPVHGLVSGHSSWGQEKKVLDFKASGRAIGYLLSQATTKVSTVKLRCFVAHNIGFFL